MRTARSLKAWLLLELSWRWAVAKLLLVGIRWTAELLLRRRRWGWLLLLLLLLRIWPG